MNKYQQLWRIYGIVHSIASDMCRSRGKCSESQLRLFIDFKDKYSKFNDLLSNIEYMEMEQQYF